MGRIFTCWQQEMFMGFMFQDKTHILLQTKMVRFCLASARGPITENLSLKSLN